MLVQVQRDEWYLRNRSYKVSIIRQLFVRPTQITLALIPATNRVKPVAPRSFRILKTIHRVSFNYQRTVNATQSILLRDLARKPHRSRSWYIFINSFIANNWEQEKTAVWMYLQCSCPLEIFINCCLVDGSEEKPSVQINLQRVARYKNLCTSSVMDRSKKEKVSRLIII